MYFGAQIHKTYCIFLIGNNQNDSVGSSDYTESQSEKIQKFKF